MDRKSLVELGQRLRGIGHRRRELAEMVFDEQHWGGGEDSHELYKEFSRVTQDAIDLMEQQRDILEREIAEKIT